MNQQRRRLTVSACDPVVDEARKDYNDAGDLCEKIQKYLGTLPSVETGRRCVLIRSKTDATRKDSFSDKDQVVSVLGTKMSDEEARDWVSSRGINFVCRKGMKPEAPNQDAFSVLVVEHEFALYGVLDGHGPNGHHASDCGQEHLIAEFLGDRLNNGIEASLAFKQAFASTQDMLAKSSMADFSLSGATCTFAFHGFKDSTLVVAHVGDSRAIMLKEDATVADLTVDHKPNLPEEKARIESSKPPGRVVFDGYYNHRVFAMKGMYPGLNMSRALGDLVGHREAGISAEPDCKMVELKLKGAKVEPTLMICSDGVWEFIESPAVMQLYQKSANPSEGIQKVAKQSWDKWMEDSGNEVSDDITGVVVRLATAAGTTIG